MHFETGFSMTTVGDGTRLHAMVEHKKLVPCTLLSGYKIVEVRSEMMTLTIGGGKRGRFTV